MVPPNRRPASGREGDPVLGRHAILIAAAASGLLASLGSAHANGPVPFYGYAEYFGGPVVYYTRDPDVQQSTRYEASNTNYGVRTYSTGGPFWGYQPVTGTLAPKRAYRAHRHARVLRRKG